ncbi:hypothetical protein K450DRAFT_261449 [Umbelopsis ramanniana AG]|uniref:Uncharacterized protein n=1 Tax=Umbelopsis ramanniana AG TaxID=1314678 RepID=A0AAD5E090_UMBRA|nr:uncharacterized protein K450DRAFT_261449 [Umbelopsis ramanniana AG]KAI8575488.1 hypothetical protein K450DRAFT_261449 [Umbelopsis ramanniana AG]
MQCENQDNVDHHHYQYIAEVISDDRKVNRNTNPFICSDGQPFNLEKASQCDDEDQTFFFLGPQQELLSPALSASTACELSYDNNVDLATRIFYATCHKFATAAQQVPKYSFRQSLLLHSMYSKSQQILLGIEDIKPTVILSGDDFMFTPPVQTVQSSLSDWALDVEDDSFLDGYILPQNDDYGCFLEEGGMSSNAHSTNNPFTHMSESNSKEGVITGNVFEAFIPISPMQTLSIENQNDDKNDEVAASTTYDIKSSRAVSEKEISNWFTASSVDKIARSQESNDAEYEDEDEYTDADVDVDADSIDNIEIKSQEESDGDDSDVYEAQSQESESQELVPQDSEPQETSSEVDPLPQNKETGVQGEASIEKDSKTISTEPMEEPAEPEPLLKIMRELEGYSVAITLATPDGSSSMIGSSTNASEGMAGPKEVHQGIRTYITTLQTLVHQKLVDSNSSQTVTANGKRVTTNVGFFRRWLSWLSSVIKVWKLFFLIAESLLVSFGDAVLQRIIIHTLGRQLESAPVIATS